MNAKNRLARLATATGCVLWMGAAVAQGGPGGAVGGPSNGYGGAAEMPAPSRQNTPTTGGGPTTQTSRSTRDEAATDRPTGSSKMQGNDASSHATSMADGMTGTISKVDSDKNTIELQGDRTLHVDPSTEIRRDGQKASFSDLHEGDDVRASFQGDDRSTVKRLDVLSGSSSTAPSSSSGSTSSSPSSTGSSSGSSSSSGR